jgi:hypothetical protein
MPAARVLPSKRHHVKFIEAVEVRPRKPQERLVAIVSTSAQVVARDSYSMGANAEAEARDATVNGGGETDAGHPEGVGRSSEQ